MERLKPVKSLLFYSGILNKTRKNFLLWLFGHSGIYLSTLAFAPLVITVRQSILSRPFGKEHFLCWQFQFSFVMSAIINRDIVNIAASVPFLCGIMNGMFRRITSNIQVRKIYNMLEEMQKNFDESKLKIKLAFENMLSIELLSSCFQRYHETKISASISEMLRLPIDTFRNMPCYQCQLCCQLLQVH